MLWLLNRKLCHSRTRSHIVPKSLHNAKIKGSFAKDIIDFLEQIYRVASCYSTNQTTVPKQFPFHMTKKSWPLHQIYTMQIQQICICCLLCIIYSASASCLSCCHGQRPQLWLMAFYMACQNPHPCQLLFAT